MKIAKLLVLGVMLLIGSSAKAVDGNVWKTPAFPANALPEVTEFTTYQEGQTVYLYNVATHLFYTNGNNWATRASLLFATGGDGNGATAGEAVRGIKVEFTRTDAAIEKGEGVVELKDDVKGAGTMISAFADAWDGIWTDNNTNANRFWKVTANGDSYRISNVTTEPDKFLGWNGKDTRLYLLAADAEGAGIDWKIVSPEAYDKYIATITDEHLTTVKNWLASWDVYYQALALKAVLDEAETIGADVAAQISIYNNTASTLEELTQAITDAQAAITAREAEMAADNYGNATADKPVDVTSLFIANPTFVGNKYDGWSGDAFGGYNPKENAEHYNKTYNTYQELKDLKPGVYKFNVDAFYRAGDAGPAYTNFKAGNAASKYAKIYAATSTDSLSNNIASPYAAGLTAAMSTGSWSSATDDETGATYYIPNNMEAADEFFAAGNCTDNHVFIGVTDGNLKVGVRKDSNVGNDWSIFDNFTLTYYGNGADAYQMWMDEFVASISNYTIPEGAVYTESYFDAYNALKTSGIKASSMDEARTVLNVLNDLQNNIALWEEYKAIVATAVAVAARSDLNPDYSEPVGDYDMDLDDNLKAHSMDNEALQKLIDEIQAAIDEAMRHPMDDADVTKYLVNPDFGTNDDTGWTGRSSITNIAASCAEAYEKGDFDFYQVVKNAPVGVYEISLQGFVRQGANDVAWPAYRDDSDIEKTMRLKNETNWAGVYMNKKWTALNNCYDVREMGLADFPSNTSETRVGPAPYGLNDAAGEPVKNSAGADVYVANGMSTSQDAFDLGYYKKSAFGLVAKEGDEMRVGIKGNLGGSGSWTWAIWDNFRLYYRGFKADVVREVLEEEIANAELYKAEVIGTNVRTIIDEKIAAANAVKGSEDGREMFDALTGIFELSDTVRSSRAIFNELKTAYESLYVAIGEAVAGDAAVAEAKALFDEVGDNYETNYTDEVAMAKTAEIQAMIKKLAVPENMSSASDDTPVDCTQMIQNNNYDAANNDGWTLDANPGFSSGVIEVYNANFNEYQDVELPAAGTYTLGVQGFYRFGFADKEYETYTANPEENNNLKLYVKIGDEETIVDMPRLASDGSEEYTSKTVTNGQFVAGDDLPADSQWQWTWMTEPVATADSTSATGVRIINGMIPVATAFANGKFGASLTFKLNEPGTVRIGLKKEVQEEGNWCIWDNWKLTYFGTNSSKEVTAIEQIAGAGEAAKTEFFSLNGTRIQKPMKGVAIMKQTLSDGSVKVRKVIIK